MSDGGEFVEPFRLRDRVVVDECHHLAGSETDADVTGAR